MSATVSVLPQPLEPPTHHVSSGNIMYKSITPDNIETPKSLNQELFPVAYPDAYYAVTMRTELTGFCKLIYADDVPVGQVTCTFKPLEREGEIVYDAYGNSTSMNLSI
ncbi:hypothetical protein FRC11_010268 [Ceratobasidium sp. 423]|nr:hypothetical protein FRC11_010268 [Ceratobasidium sp. 423]